jgi:hypothetical protein
MKFTSVANNAYLKEGEYEVEIVSAVIGEYKDGSATLDITFKATEPEFQGEIHIAKMATLGFRKYYDEEGASKHPDSLTDAERASGLFGQDTDEAGNVKSLYAMVIGTMKAGKVTKLPREQWKRAVSKVKTLACQEIIGRVFNSCGFPANEENEETALVGCELRIELEKRLTPSSDDEYVRLKTTKSLVEQDI